jgi:signal transduction histidine kinase/ActR/RegA family two-component response regulator
MRLETLARHLRTRREAILKRWQDTVCSFADKARELSEPELRDHAPLLLEQVAAALEGKETPEVEPVGWEHGRQRWDHAFRITEVIQELSIMRQTLVDEVDEHAVSAELTPDESREARRRLHEVIDRSAAASASQYVTAALHQHQALEERLEAANQQKDHFLAMLSHELRGPLASILNAARLLQHADLADANLERAGEVIERQALYQARLIDDLLDINRIAQGKVTLHPEVTDLKAALSQGIEACLPSIEAKGLTLKQGLPDEPLLVEGDPVRLAQIVINILTNAGRYTDSPGTITVTAGQEDGKAVVRVRDTGIGIAPEMLSRVFEQFVQADSSLDRRQGGLGLGLTLARKLAELHGGAVEARSEGLGKGSEFTIRLPAARKGEARREPLAAETSSDRLVGRRVVLVDDSADSRTTLADVLEMLGHHVLLAADGPEALRLAWEEQPEAYVVDIGLPGMDGYEVARKLRQTPAGEQALLIALSGYGSPQDRERARQAGFDAHLTKPANIEELQGLLTSATKQQGARRGKQ